MEQQPEQLKLIVRLLIFNELSPSRGPNNMAVLAVLVQPWPDRAATILAEVFMELLLNRDDYLRALRFFFQLDSVMYQLNYPILFIGLCYERWFVLSDMIYHYQPFVQHFFTDVCKKDAKLQLENSNSR